VSHRKSNPAGGSVGLPDFHTWKERDTYFAEHAEYFTTVKKDGVGHYDRDDHKTLAQAEAAVKLKQNVGGGNYLIYAVIGEQSALVKPMPYQPKRDNAQTSQHTDT